MFAVVVEGDAVAKVKRRRQRGLGQVVPPRAPEGLWGVRVRQGGRAVFKGGFATKALAERVLAKHGGEVAQRRAGIAPDPTGTSTLAVLAEPFLDARLVSNRAAPEDRYRWKKHLKPWFGHLKPFAVDQGMIRRFIEAKLQEGLAPSTVRVLVSILSSLFMDIVEQGLAPSNPCRGLPRATMRLMKSKHDPRTVPFIEKLLDVKRVYLDLPEPLSVAYALGAFGGLRTGEQFALRWPHVDLAARRIHVRESIDGPLKDCDSRMVPILDVLLPILTAWKLKTGGTGLLAPPLRRDGDNIDKGTPGKYLSATLTKFGLARKGLGWYQATRHTFASQWVMAGGSIEKLKEILGHYSVVVTERYAHLRVDLFSESDLKTLSLDVTPGTAEPTPVGQR